MNVLKIKLAFKQDGDKLIATELLYDFEPYLESWSKIHNTINFADLNNAWASLADNLEVGCKAMDN